MLKDKPTRTVEPVKQAARQLRQSATLIISSCQRFVDMANANVTKHTKVAIAAELGTDAAEMVALFNAAKLILVNHDGQIAAEIEDAIK